MKTKLMNKFEIKSEIKLNYGIKYNVKNLYYNCRDWVMSWPDNLMSFSHNYFSSYENLPSNLLST
jgi:hypothetical protein